MPASKKSSVVKSEPVSVSVPVVESEPVSAPAPKKRTAKKADPVAETAPVVESVAAEGDSLHQVLKVPGRLRRLPNAGRPSSARAAR
jgi:hypothetical protein